MPWDIICIHDTKTRFDVCATSIKSLDKIYKFDEHSISYDKKWFLTNC